MQIPVKKQLWESPRDTLGHLPTTGRGIGVMVLDQGFDVQHPDLKPQIAACVSLHPEDRFDHDPVGHGTHVLGIVGGNGASSQGQVRGAAPGARLIPARIDLDPKGSWEDVSRQFARAVHWALENQEQFNLRVINCSFVLPLVEFTDPNTGLASLVDPIAYSIQKATEAGIVIVAGVGNFGEQRITTPAGHPDVIAVGALDSGGTPAVFEDDRVAGFSSRGRSIHGEVKPDLVAPGVRIMSTNAPQSELEERNVRKKQLAKEALQAPPDRLQELVAEQVASGHLPVAAASLPEASLRRALLGSLNLQASLGQERSGAAYLAQDGSSMASPYVAGVVAQMLEVNPQLTPAEVKAILKETARPLPQAPSEAQGAGAIQPEAAIQAAARRLAVQP